MTREKILLAKVEARISAIEKDVVFHFCLKQLPDMDRFYLSGRLAEAKAILEMLKREDNP